MNKSVYDSPEQTSEIKRHILTVLVDNEPGVLAKVIGMFSGRGYNIDSLNVAEVSDDDHLSRITIVTQGTSDVVTQIEKQLLRIVPVHSVTNLDQEGSSVEAEVALVCITVKENDQSDGVTVTKVDNDEIKLDNGDIILEVNREIVESIVSFTSLVEKYKETGRSSLLLKIQRGEETSWVTIKFVDN